ncbi:MAG: cobalamin B12-binding domain-containing protein [Candidatus Sericytochromatia bacterium]|nr:cobalamin B12-binding domain-containing protein [Candidatus Sericytochromatia bacterium]
MSIVVGLVQYNSAFHHFLPYSVGLLQACVMAFAPEPERYRFLLPRVFAGPLAAEACALAEADVVAFSVYVWNIERSLALARLLKAQNPQCLIVFGGPQVPDRAEGFLRAHPQVDLCAHGEGEATFVTLLEALPDWQTKDIAGLSWLDAEGHFQTTPRAPRRKELAELPSPYLTGVFEPLMAAYPETSWAALWETNRGCPFTCTFCDWGSATQAKVHRFDTERLKAELDWFADKRIGYIFCCDANFGILRRDLELAQHAADLKQRTGFPGALAVQNAKNVSKRTFEIQCLLARAGLDAYVTISLQSLHEPTLKASGRSNISLSDFATLQARLRREGVHTYTDLILGLPEETYDSFVDGLCTVVEQGQYHAVNVFIADILPNAPMADPAYCERYGLQTVRVPAVSYQTPVQRDSDGITEFQQLVIATAAMPAADWRRAHVLLWLTQLLLFKPGLLRIPMLLLQHLGGVSLRQQLENFVNAADSPLLQAMVQALHQQARAIQQGQPVFVPWRRAADDQLTWHTANEAVLAQLVQQGQLAVFYPEAERLLRQLWQQSELPLTVLDDALFHSAAILHLHHQLDLPGLSYQTRWNVWDCYQNLLQAEPVQLQPQQRHYSKSWSGAPFQLRWRELNLPAAPTV